MEGPEVYSEYLRYNGITSVGSTRRYGLYAIFCFSLDDYLAHYRNPERRIVEFRVEAVELADVECYVQVTESLTLLYTQRR